MRHQKRLPIPALSSFIRHYWYFETDMPFSHLSFPYGGFEMICYLENPNTMRWLGSADDFEEPAIFYAGQLTKPFVMTFNKPCRCVGVSLYPWAGKLLYNIPANQFTNALVALDNLEQENGFYDQLKGCVDDAALFNCLEAYMLKKLYKKQNDPLVYAIAQQIINNPNRESLSIALTKVGLSRRRVEQRFMEATGLSMGLFTRKARFQKAVHLLQNETCLSLTTLGFNAGYYDQPHFIADFKRFSGLSPKIFQEHKTELTDFFKTLVLVK